MEMGAGQLSVTPLDEEDEELERAIEVGWCAYTDEDTIGCIRGTAG